ncbi:uncharacterized protein LOC117108025 isoform X2 [Anneissia japonica]|uniref:uncharacterized protein LOC117108025 isoform X2 n=1 Tax=Anneissia japonica TaxID=1529436 RepID=UPI00142575E0|nr:uncharacterized protein LOC117108025 isoform X2 [Anneissia japonica]
MECILEHDFPNTKTRERRSKDIVFDMMTKHFSIKMDVIKRKVRSLYHYQKNIVNRLNELELKVIYLYRRTPSRSPAQLARTPSTTTTTAFLNQLETVKERKTSPLSMNGEPSNVVTWKMNMKERYLYSIPILFASATIILTVLLLSLRYVRRQMMILCGREEGDRYYRILGTNRRPDGRNCG